jgi:hypothetical protein
MDLKTEPVFIIFGIFGLLLVIHNFNKSVHDRVFIVLSLIAIGAYLYYETYAKPPKHDSTPLRNAPAGARNNDVSKKLANTPMPSPHYQVYRFPSSFKYSMRVDDYVNIIRSIEFVDKYDVSILNRVKTYCEAFFKTHYNITIGKYDSGLYKSELHDFRKLALDAMHELVFVLPKTSTIVDVPDLDDHITRKILALSRLLNKFIRSV